MRTDQRGAGAPSARPAARPFDDKAPVLTAPEPARRSAAFAARHQARCTSPAARTSSACGGRTAARARPRRATCGTCSPGSCRGGRLERHLVRVPAASRVGEGLRSGTRPARRGPPRARARSSSPPTQRAPRASPRLARTHAPSPTPFRARPSRRAFARAGRRRRRLARGRSRRRAACRAGRARRARGAAPRGQGARGPGAERSASREPATGTAHLCIHSARRVGR